MRTFASRTDKDLAIGVSIATFIIFVVLALIGSTGLIAVGAGYKEPGSMAFFLLIGDLPAWVVGFVLVMSVSLSCAVFDSLQSAMVSTACTELFRNRIPLLWIRGMVVLITIPVIVIAIKSPSILQIYLISNLAACAAVPPAFLGLSTKLYFIQGFEVLCGSLGGMFSVWIFGMIFYNGDVKAAANLFILASLYTDDWSTFGTFLVAPIASLLFCFAACTLRLGLRWLVCKYKGERFDGLDQPTELGKELVEGQGVGQGAGPDVKRA